MGSKNACASEFACILGRNIKYSVITIIIIPSQFQIPRNKTATERVSAKLNTVLIELYFN